MYFLFAGWDAYQIPSIFETYRGTFPTLSEAKEIAQDREATWAEVFTVTDGELVRASQLVRGRWLDF